MRSTYPDRGQHRRGGGRRPARRQSLVVGDAVNLPPASSRPPARARSCSAAAPAPGPRRRRGRAARARRRPRARPAGARLPAAVGARRSRPAAPAASTPRWSAGTRSCGCSAGLRAGGRPSAPCSWSPCSAAAGVGKSRLVAGVPRRRSSGDADGAGRPLPALRQTASPSGRWPRSSARRPAIGADDPPAAARAKLAAVVDGEPHADAGGRADRRSSSGWRGRPGARSRRPFWAIRRLLEALAGERPLVVVLDDLHWAEPTFLDLLEHLADGARDGADPAGRRGPARAARAAPGLGRRRGQRYQHRCWSRSAATSRARCWTGCSAAGLPAEAPRTRIADAAGGNPLFVEELLADAGRRRPAAPARTAAGRSPATWTRSASRRPSRPCWRPAWTALDGRERAVLERAAVVGQAFEQGAVAELRREAPGPRSRRSCGRWSGSELLRRPAAPPRRGRLPVPAPAGPRRRLPGRPQGGPGRRSTSGSPAWLEARAAGAGCASTRRSSATTWSRPAATWPSWARSTSAARELGASGRRPAGRRRAPRPGRGDIPAATNLLDRALAVAPGWRSPAAATCSTTWPRAWSRPATSAAPTRF